MFRVAFALITVIQAVAQPALEDELKDALTHAEALYYGARFNESITLLARVDETLKARPGHLDEKIDTKLRLALAHIGMNDASKAKAFLVELYALNPDFVFDAEQFSPKVLAIAAEAKAEEIKMQCQAAQENARTYLDAGNTTALLDLVRSSRSKCNELAAIGPAAAESFYRTGVAAYRRGEFPDALRNFEAAVTLSPEHEMAFQYIDLTQSKLTVDRDRLLLEWQRHFDARQLKEAAEDYRQIVALDNSRTSPATKQVMSEYQKALAGLVQNWDRACSAGDALAMDAIRNQVSEILPEPALGQDARDHMSNCATPATPQVGAASAIRSARGENSCIPMQSPLVMARLKTRVDPVITSDVRNYLKNGQTIVRIKVRVSEAGDVTVLDVVDGNPLLNNPIRTAVSQWKFTTIRDQSGPRCVETEVPITFSIAK
jgi:tetratricopeptide (TPR) repeat protein